MRIYVKVFVESIYHSDGSWWRVFVGLDIRDAEADESKGAASSWKPVGDEVYV